MKIGFLSAAMQTPPGTTSEMFINEPRKAAMTAAERWLKWAAENQIETVELGCAHAPAHANVPPESMADPVAHHVPIITAKDGSGEDLDQSSALLLVEACQGKVAIGTLGAFENLLHENAVIRRQNIEHVRRAIRAAELLFQAGGKTEGVTIFVGRNLKFSIEENMHLFAEVVIPIVRYAKEREVKIFIENCPMCGWAPADTFVHNIANCPLNWIVMARIVENADLVDWCYINHDASHDILQGFRPEWSYKVMDSAGYAWFIGRFHGKGLSPLLGRIASCGYGGQRIATISPWDRMAGDQPLPGAEEHNPLAQSMGLQVDWLGASIGIREDLGLDVEKVTFTVEHEQSEFRNAKLFRNQDHQWEITTDLLLGSIEFITGIEMAASSNTELRELIDSESDVFPKTWVRQQMNMNSLLVLGGLEEVVQKGLNWELPEISTTSDLVLGSDL